MEHQQHAGLRLRDIDFQRAHHTLDRIGARDPNKPTTSSTDRRTAMRPQDENTGPSLRHDKSDEFVFSQYYVEKMRVVAPDEAPLRSRAHRKRQQNLGPQTRAVHARHRSTPASPGQQTQRQARRERRSQQKAQGHDHESLRRVRRVGLGDQPQESGLGHDRRLRHEDEDERQEDRTHRKAVQVARSKWLHLLT